MRLKISDQQKKILEMIGAGTIILTALIAPNAAASLYNLIKQGKAIAKYRAKKSINKLIEKDIIYLFGEEVRLTKHGKEILKLIEIEDLVLVKPDKWDKIWHLVSYDIPEYKKKERDYFRSKLTSLGFLQIQDSLWVYPFECKQEIAVISQTLGISPYVAYLNTDKLPQQERLSRRFRLID